MKALSCFMLLFCLNVVSVFAQVEQESSGNTNPDIQVSQTGDNSSYWTVSLSGGATLYQGEWDGDMKKADFMANSLLPVGFHQCGDFVCNWTEVCLKTVQ